MTIKNRYPLPLISELLDQLSQAKVFSKIDLKDAYYRLAIKEVDRWKTAFRTKYGHFEYNVLPMGLTNAPATFQAYMQKALAGLVDNICIVYLDDIVIYSQSAEEHEKHLRMVTDRLSEYKLYTKPSKCAFFQTRIEFLGFIVGTDGIQMDLERVKAVKEWQAPTSYHDIQVFMGFTNFYRKFIKGYSRITAPTTALLKGSVNGRKAGPFQWPEEASQSFQRLKDAFMSATILRHWDLEKRTRVETDASDKAISGILSQLWESEWRPVAYWSRKLTMAEMRWATGQKELLRSSNLWNTGATTSRAWGRNSQCTPTIKPSREWSMHRRETCEDD